MSRSAIPLYHAQPRLTQSDHVEVFIAEGGYAFGYDESGAVESARFLTVFVNLDMGPKQLTPLLTELSGAMRGVLEHYYLFPREGLGIALGSLLFAFSASTLNIVVQLPEAGRLSMQDVDDILALFIESHHSPSIVAAVARCPDDWQRLSHVKHFVASASSTVQRDAVALFKSLSTFMAPEALVEADDGELKQALGTALAPARLAHAMWVHDEQRLRFLSERDRELVTESAYIFLTLFCFDTGVNIATQLFGQAHESWRVDASLPLSITSGFFEDSHRLPENCSAVVVLCKKRVVSASG